MAVRKSSKVKRVATLVLTGVLALQTSIFAGYVTDKVLQRTFQSQAQQQLKEKFGVNVYVQSRASDLSKEDYSILESSLASGNNSSLDAIFIESDNFFAKSPIQQIVSIASKEGSSAFYDSFTHFAGYNYVSVPFIKKNLLDHEIAHARTFSALYGSLFTKTTFRKEWDALVRKEDYISFWSNIFYQLKFSDPDIQSKLNNYNKKSFSSAYAATNIYEDVAETISTPIITDEHGKPRYVAQSSILEQKINLLKRYRMIK